MGIFTKGTRALERPISCHKPLATVVLRVLAVFRVVIVRSRYAPVAELLRKLAVPIDVGEALTTAVRLRNSFNLDSEVVMFRHCSISNFGCVTRLRRAGRGDTACWYPQTQPSAWTRTEEGIYFSDMLRGYMVLPGMRQSGWGILSSQEEAVCMSKRCGTTRLKRPTRRQCQGTSARDNISD